MTEKNKRIYPELSNLSTQPTRAISFVVIQFSNDYLYNFLQSECIKHPINEVITVNNFANLYFNNLSQAIIFGVQQTSHDLIAIIHEDVLLPRNWQQHFEQSLNELEKQDNNWGGLGSVGWDNHDAIHGHLSDPNAYRNTFKDAEFPFKEIERLDEQLLIFHRSRLPEFDRCLPGIHHVGRDLLLHLRHRGFKSYVIDAPTIHKYADDTGKIILSRDDSNKIKDRESLTYLADKFCCDDYITHKWPQLTIAKNRTSRLITPTLSKEKQQQLNSPFILLSKGGSGSRLLSVMAQDFDIFLGNHLNISGDSLELVNPIYQGIFEKYRCETSWQKEQIIPRLQASAANMIADLPCDKKWGFKLPEAVFLLPELHLAFPQARYIHFMRDPLSTCLRRNHMTARLDNHIGRITLAMAYDFMGLTRNQIIIDSAAENMAYTIIHQLCLIQTHLSSLSEDCFITLRFENVLNEPGREVAQLSTWLKTNRAKAQLENMIDVNRVNNSKVIYPPNIVAKVAAILAETQMNFGYL